MKNLKLHEWALFAIALLARLPFLSAGYGREEDAWAQALNARLIWDSGQYEVSRLPGHPIYELLLAALYSIEHSPLFFNLLSAIVSALSIVVFYKIAQRFLIPSPFLLSLGFGFIPSFFIAGTYTIDYNFGLLFLLLAFWQMLNEKYLLAGIFVGIATGFRISHLGFLLPLVILTYTRQHRFDEIIKMGIAATVISIVAYLPAFFTYGFGFLDFHKPPFPGWASVLYKASIGVWGAFLLLFIVGSTAYLIAKLKHLRHTAITKLPRNYWLALLLLLAMQLFVFLRLPFKAEFFLVFIPFFVLYLASFYSSKWVLAFSLVSIFSCFFVGFDYQNSSRAGAASPASINFNSNGKTIFMDALQGPVILDHTKRVAKSKLVYNFNQWSQQQKGKAWVIAGWYYPEIEMTQEYGNQVKLDYYSSQAELENAHRAGYSIYYLPEINQANAKINAHYLADSIAKPWTSQ